MHEDKLVIAVENAGLGPALNVRGLVELGGSGSTHAWGRTLHVVEGIADGATNTVAFWKDEGDLTPQVELRADSRTKTWRAPPNGRTSTTT